MAIRILGYILIGAAALLALGVLLLSSKTLRSPLLFSPTQVLAATWAEYKVAYLEPETFRTLDKQRENITTSEGQSYTMLRAVWMDDQETFDASLEWTKNNLWREDRLFSWLFGKHADGTYGVLTEQGGNNTASDGDQDIALALVFAYSRWQEPRYIGDARTIINAIWEKEVITIKGVPYLAANDLEKTSRTQTAVLNPSYMSPATYKIFALIDTEHPWEKLADSSYDVIKKSSAATLDSSQSSGLPPDWVYINKTTGELSAPPSGSSATTNFSYDAIRTPWRLALDWQWFKDPRAKDALSGMSFLEKEWNTSRKISSSYAHDGSVLQLSESPAVYGGVLGYFTVMNPNVAQDVYQEKLAYLFNQDTNNWAKDLSYYDNNWTWFGLGLYNNLLPNLSAKMPVSAFQQFK